MLAEATTVCPVMAAVCRGAARLGTRGIARVVGRLRRARSLRSARGRAGDELGCEDDLLVPVLGVGRLVEQQLGCGASEPSTWLSHRRERHRGRVRTTRAHG